MNQDSNRRSGRQQGGKKYGRSGQQEGFQGSRPRAFRAFDEDEDRQGDHFRESRPKKTQREFRGGRSKDRRSAFGSKARPYGNDRPYSSDRPYGKARSYSNDRPSAKARPYSSDRSSTPAPLDEDQRDFMEEEGLSPETTDALRFEDELIFGRNAVREAVQAGLHLNKIYVAEGEEGGLGGDRRLKDIYQEAVEKGYLVQLVPKAKLDRMCAGHQGKHQGIAAMAAPIEYADPYEVLKTVLSQKEQVTVILLDQIEDSYNLASMIRSAECAGADLIVMPERRSVAVNYLVARESAGALAHVPVARVGNLRHFMKNLKDQGFWLYGLDMEGTVNYRHEKYPDRVAIVTGNEGKGLRPSTLQDCDFVLSIPMQGKINSLNAAVATALVLFEIAGSRADARP